MGQAAALPYRMRGGRAEILMITSRETRRWIIPKGEIERGEAPHLAAAREAFEEAGVEGVVGETPVGRFRYLKRGLRGREWLSIRAWPLRVEVEHSHWPEMDERRREWLPLYEAAHCAGDAGLAALLAKLARTEWTPCPAPWQPHIETKNGDFGAR